MAKSIRLRSPRVEVFVFSLHEKSAEWRERSSQEEEEEEEEFMRRKSGKESRLPMKTDLRSEFIETTAALKKRQLAHSSKRVKHQTITGV